MDTQQLKEKWVVLCNVTVGPSPLTDNTADTGAHHLATTHVTLFVFFYI